MDETIETILKRRSIRRFSSLQVSGEDIETINADSSLSISLPHHIPTTHQCEECTIVPGLGTYVTKSIDKKSPEIGKFPCSAVFLSSPSVRLRLCRSHVRTVSGTPKKDPPDGGSFFGVPTGEFCFSKTPGKRRAEPAFACQSTPFELVRIRGGFASYLCFHSKRSRTVSEKACM